jgi:hypothetical protein
MGIGPQWLPTYGAIFLAVGACSYPGLPKLSGDEDAQPGSDAKLVDATTTAACAGAFTCPAPASGKQTICGQVYDLADNTKFAAADATGEQCTTVTTAGPCALKVVAFDALSYANAPTTTTPLTVGMVFIDDCGRYRVADITPPPGPFVALAWDDGGASGPTGVTVPTGVALATLANTKVEDFESWIVDQTTTSTWQSTGGPTLASGIYSAIFRTHGCVTGTCTGDAFANQTGVTITKSGNPQAANDYYFQSEPGRMHIDATATATTMNGTALYTNASVNDSLVYSGAGGITDTVNCGWETHAAASIPGIVFMQIYRPSSKPTKTCTQ